MRIRNTKLQGLIVVESEQKIDSRGVFERFYCEAELCAIVGQRRVLQINHSRTESVGVVRGLHYQNPPHAEMKLVRCIKGKVWDVAVDLRENSPTFLKWHAEELTPENLRMFVIPEGFAHGFQVVEPSSELLYLHTSLYTPSAEGGVRYDDPCLSIEWPIPVTDISERDKCHPLLGINFRGINL